MRAPSPTALLGAGLLALATVAASAVPASLAEPVVFHHENVLGTSLELKVRAPDAAAARAAEARVLAEIDRLSGIFSTYTAASEFSAWQSTRGTPVPVSDELFTVLALSDRWHDASGGAFNPAVESLSRVWKSAANRGALPSPAALAEGRRAAAAPSWQLDPARHTATRLSDAPLTLNAIAKGWIVEHAGQVALAADPRLQGLLLNVGGDLRHWGDLADRVEIADPREDGEAARPFTAVQLRNAALASSGGYRRHVAIGGRTYSHIIDPRTGQPADGVLGASVIAPDSATADALATTLCVLAPEEITHRTASLTNVDWLVIRTDGTVLRSPGWIAREARPAAEPADPTLLARADGAVPGGVRPAAPSNTAPTANRAAAWPANFELRVDYELNQPEGGRYARPYVALWIEDAEGFPVRTLVLWLLQGDKGQRWLADLRRWYRSDQMRALVDEKNLVTSVSAATRPPGRYHATWDGLDDHGQPVKRGKYTLFLEAAREHGTYQLMRQDLEIGGDPFKAELKGNVEIKGATIDFQRRTTAAPAAPANSAR